MEASPPYLENLPADESVYFLTPVLRHFAHKPYHVHSATVRWNKPLLVAELKSQLIRSKAGHRWDVDVPPFVRQRELLFHLPGDVFVHLDEYTVHVHAACPTVAAQVLTDLNHRFAKPPKAGLPNFHLLSYGRDGVQSHPVALTRACLHSPDDLALHYGNDFVLWEAELIQRLQNQPNGLVVLRGDPGVGKTTFLRHLTARLAKTHRAFLVPTSHFNMLASPEMPVFWAGQNYRSSLTNLVILEDAEALLGKRRGSNDDQVSNLLNFSDGMMGDCMKVQIVTTVNAPLEKLDPAITRRGRMLGYRQFRRLTRAEALRLSTAKNLTLGDGHEFSLADIYRGPDSADPVPAEPTMGFHRQTTR